MSDGLRGSAFFVRFFLFLTFESQKVFFTFYLNSRTAMLVFISLLVGDDNNHEARSFFIFTRDRALAVVSELCLEVVNVRSLVLPLIFFCDFLQCVIRIRGLIRTAFLFFICFQGSRTYLFLLWSLLFCLTN